MEASQLFDPISVSLYSQLLGSYSILSICPFLVWMCLFYLQELSSQEILVITTCLESLHVEDICLLPLSNSHKMHSVILDLPGFPSWAAETLHLQGDIGFSLCPNYS